MTVPASFDYYRMSYNSLELFRARLFWILEYLHLYNEICWGWDMSEHKIYCVSHTSYTHNLKVILYSISNIFMYEIKFHGTELNICGFMSVLQNFQCLKHFELNIFRLGIFNLYTCAALSTVLSI
jgi:hypothetical protein